MSFVQRAVAAVLYEVEPFASATRLVLQSELVANEPMPALPGDPRTAASLVSPLRSEQFSDSDAKVVLVHSTKTSELRMAAGMDHVVEGPPETETGATESGEDLGRVTIMANVQPGQRLRMVKFIAYGWSSRRSSAALRDQVAGALAEAQHTGWGGLLAGQRAYLDDFWARADVELEGDAELQQAVRFALFHTLQAGARGERRAIAAKGLTGPGYNGHVFWDTETFVLPVLTYTAPQAARDSLHWRHATLGLARERARLLGLAGAAFPWRTIAGQECSSYWPAGTAAFHIGADIADAVGRYQAATDGRRIRARGRARTSRGDGATVALAGSPRRRRTLSHRRRHRPRRIQRDRRQQRLHQPDGTAKSTAGRRRRRTPPGSRHGRSTSTWRRRPPGATPPTPSSSPTTKHWASIPKPKAFTTHQPWDFAHTAPEQYPLLLHFPYFDLYRKQVVKQADLVLALHLRGDAFSEESKARDFAYYEALTVRDSSLSACTQAVVAAEVGHLELAYDYFGEATLIDLDNLEHNTRDGLHIASLAGAWIVAVAGFGGMRDHDGSLTFAPRLPERLNRLAFRLCFRGRRLKVEVESDQARYSLLEGAPLELTHHGQTISVSARKPVTRAIPPPPARDAPRQPPGRAPARRQPARRAR